MTNLSPQMDTFTLAETTAINGTATAVKGGSDEEGRRSFFDYDATGRVKSEDYVPDLEEQAISDEFKRPPY